MFKVIQEQKPLLVALRDLEYIQYRLCSTFSESKCMSDGWNDEGGVTDGCEEDHMYAICEVTYQRSSHLKRQARFAHASRAGEREQMHIRP